MNVTARITNSVAVLDLKGRLVRGDDIEGVSTKVEELLQKQIRAFLFNMRQVPLMDCGGIGELLRCYESIRERNGTMKLLQIRERPRYLLELTRVLTVFETFESERAAIESYMPIASGITYPRNLRESRSRLSTARLVGLGAA